MSQVKCTSDHVKFWYLKFWDVLKQKESWLLNCRWRKRQILVHCNFLSYGRHKLVFVSKPLTVELPPINFILLFILKYLYFCKIKQNSIKKTIHEFDLYHFRLGRVHYQRSDVFDGSWEIKTNYVKRQLPEIKLITTKKFQSHAMVTLNLPHNQSLCLEYKTKKRKETQPIFLIRENKTVNFHRTC